MKREGKNLRVRTDMRVLLSKFHYEVDRHAQNKADTHACEPVSTCPAGVGVQSTWS